MSKRISLLSACLIVIGGASAQTAAPDAIYHNGKVVTVDGRFSVARAFAVRDGRIVAVGNDREILAQAKTGTTTVHDLRGRMVLPGLIDSHVHAANAAMVEFDHVIPDMETVADVLAYFRDRAKVVPAGGLISLSQVFITRLKESRFPTRAELDAAAPKHAVAFHTGPDVMLNSLALKLNGIDRKFQVTDGGPGYLEKDSAGEPTGLLRGLDRFVNKTASVGRRPTDADRHERTRNLLRAYNQIGITAVGERGGNQQNLAVYQGLLDRKELTIRVAVSHTFPTNGAMQPILEAIDGIAANPLRKDNGWLHLIGTKVWLDGGMLTGSAYMLKPWGKSEIYGIADEKYRGVLNIPDDRLYQMVERVAKHGMQFTAHVQGDAAVTTLVNAYDRLNASIPVQPLRMGLSHSSFMTRDTVQRCARLGIVPDIQPIWLYLDARTLVRQFGYERLDQFQPLRSLFAAGAITGGGSDHMQKLGDLRSINPYNPFLGMWITITRAARWYDGRVRPEEALSREQAIQFYTRNNAHLLFWEKEIGSLEPGKRADFIIVDRDLLTCPIDDLKDTKVLQTWIEGRRVFTSEGS
ncbi:MAG: amidohydrolase [Opitutaceae bacterium]|nr:amidohydrolase [Opitutaceae bacterium]